MGWKEAEERRFYDNVRKADGMEPLKAMKLLTKACMDYVGVSKSYSTMAYYAGREWLKVFNKTSNYFTYFSANNPYRVHGRFLRSTVPSSRTGFVLRARGQC